LFNAPENVEAALGSEIFRVSCDSYRVIIDDVNIIQNLQRVSETRYTGSMGYAETVLAIHTADTTRLDSKKKVEVILQMDYKEFGSTSLLVWEVLLGKITPDD
jgi:hypothetical protein